MIGCCSAPRTKGRWVISLKEIKSGEFMPKYTQGEYSPPILDEVCVSVKACSVSSVDVDIATIHPSSYAKLKKNGFVLGRDFAGVVKDVGPNVKKFQKGNQVYGLVKLESDGTWAETIVVNEKCIALMPSNLSFEEAAAIPYSALTAYQLLYNPNALNVQPGMKVLIHDAAIDEGYFAVQLAKLRDAYVYASTNQIELSDELKNLGADEVGDYHKGDSKVSFKYAMDFSYEKELEVKLYKLLSKDNLLALSDTTKYEKVLKDGTLPVLKFSVSADGEDLEKISELVRTGKLKVAIRDRVKFYTHEKPIRENVIKGLGKAVIAIDTSARSERDSVKSGTQASLGLQTTTPEMGITTQGKD